MLWEDALAHVQYCRKFITSTSYEIIFHSNFFIILFFLIISHYVIPMSLTLNQSCQWNLGPYSIEYFISSSAMFGCRVWLSRERRLDQDLRNLLLWCGKDNLASISRDLTVVILIQWPVDNEHQLTLVSVIWRCEESSRHFEIPWKPTVYNNFEVDNRLVPMPADKLSAKSIQIKYKMLLPFPHLWVLFRAPQIPREVL